MATMFCDCERLKTLDLSGFTTAQVTNMSFMFFGCDSLTTIYVSDGWDTSALTESNSMFSGCYKLVGGMGTTYDKNHIDATYAHIDHGQSNPGYLTSCCVGDVNGDGRLSISDIAALIDFLLYGGDIPASADANGDHQISIADIATIIDKL